MTLQNNSDHARRTVGSSLRAHVLSAIASILVLFTSTATNAIVINNAAGIGTARELGAPFHSVVKVVRGSFGSCSGSLISSTSVLTAKHCTTGFSAADLWVDFTTGDGSSTSSRDVLSKIEMPTPTGVSGDLLDGSDLAVVTFTEPVIDLDPFRFFVGDLLGEIVRMVGYGWNGLGKGGHGGNSDGYRWAVDNVVDEIGGVDKADNIISTDFDSPDGTPNNLGSDIMLTSEGTTAPGDSGGPLLVKRNGEWLVAGALAGGTTGNSIYGDISWWTGTQNAESRQFIENLGGEYMSVPTPGTLLLLIAGLLLISRRASPRGRGDNVCR